LSQTGVARKFRLARSPDAEDKIMEMPHQSHKEVPFGWYTALAGLFAPRRRRQVLLLTGPRHAGDCRPHGGVA
jgi:hypothetical protein